MTRVLSHLPVRTVAAALLLAAGVLAPAGRAEAACGDYVVIDGKPAAHDPAPPGEPCHGPNCSAREAPAPAPLAPSTTPNPAPKDRPADLAATAEPSPAFDHVAEPPAGRAVHVAYQPFHPPRSV
ncbi:MAG: hypothetical protein U0804_20245 [Gemmataceae bacterium]